MEKLLTKLIKITGKNNLIIPIVISSVVIGVLFAVSYFIEFLGHYFKISGQDFILGFAILNLFLADFLWWKHWKEKQVGDE